MRGVVGQGLDDVFGGRWVEVFQGGQGFNFSCDLLDIARANTAAFRFTA